MTGSASNITTDFSPIEKALASLNDSLTPPPRNDRERDGAIQRFEYTFELTWKLAKRVLSLNGVQSQSPKSVIRDLGQQGWIADVELWFSFLKARNESSHTYQEQTAQDVFSIASQFPAECLKLVQLLKTK